jgi:peptide chain release factor 1
MSIESKFDKILQRYDELKNILSTTRFSDRNEFAKLSKEYSDLTDIASVIQSFLDEKKAFSDVFSLKSDLTLDPELRQMANAEYEEIKERLTCLEKEILVLLLPKDQDDDRGVILEIRAGTGGDEAGLFASNLLRMYQRYATLKGWQFDLLSSNESSIGSTKEASATISGKGVFARLKFESGVHRVQRVPETESSGRVHTSTATVAVLPEVEEVDIQIDEKDLIIDVFRASGAGGQHVNTTDSAVRITHIPSGVVVSQQDERSQHKNRARAMKILRARLYEAERLKKEQIRSLNRKSQVGTAERSERIRTYNFPQGRVSDHRINLTLYKIEQIMEGEALDELIDALTAYDQAQKLAQEIV